MACPLCGERCTCSYAPPPMGKGDGRVSVLIDPDGYDTSEQQFEASLTSPAAAPETTPAPEEQPEPAAALWASAAPAAQEETSAVDETPYWREEVTSRVESYRARRKRPPRERSLSLDFERAMNRALASAESPVAGESSSAVGLQSSGDTSITNELPHILAGGWEPNRPVGPDPLPANYAVLPAEETIQQAPEERALPTDDSNVIEFPRLPLVIMPPSSEEVAEPVIDRPRILDAPEAVETAQAPLAGIQLEAEEEAPAVEFELPLVVAAISQRIFAGLADLLIVALASAVFLLIVLRGGATLPPGKAGALWLLAAPILFWAVYEYMFLVHGGATPGMQIARLELVSFEGGHVSRRMRRGRALAMVLSSLSLGLGLLWSLLDEDTLCWHDRISRTYLVSRGSYGTLEARE